MYGGDWLMMSPVPGYEQFATGVVTQHSTGAGSGAGGVLAHAGCA